MRWRARQISCVRRAWAFYVPVLDCPRYGVLVFLDFMLRIIHESVLFKTCSYTEARNREDALFAFSLRTVPFTGDKRKPHFIKEIVAIF